MLIVMEGGKVLMSGSGQHSMQEDGKRQGITSPDEVERQDEQVDRLYQKPFSPVPPFEFADEVAQVFENMAQRSIPGYASVIELSALLAAQFAKPDSLVYDLGCSLGATTKHLAASLGSSVQRIVAVDSSLAMINRAKLRLGPEIADGLVVCLHEDVCTLKFQPASVVVCNFTLQFLQLDDRLALIRRIAKHLEPNGAFILAEKISFDDAYDRELHEAMHNSFRRGQGYSDLEINQKQQALSGIMITETEQQHRRRLTSAGFRHITKWFQSFNFIGLVASLENYQTSA